MNNKGQIWFAYAIVLFLVIITLFALIEPFKETLDNNRGGSTLNCPGTPTFSQSSYDSQNSFEKLVYRPTCFVTGLGLVWFVFAVIIAGVLWLWGKGK